MVSLAVSLGRLVKSVWKCGVLSGGWVMVDVLSFERSGGVSIASIALDGCGVRWMYESVACESVWNG